MIGYFYRMDRKQIVRELKDLGIFFVISLFQGVWMCPRCHTQRDYFITISFTFCMWIFLWKGNSILATFVSRRFPWMTHPTMRFVVGIVSTILYTVMSMLVAMYAFEYIFNFSFGKGFVYTIYGSVGVTILISLFLHGREFFFFWRQATLEKEKYMRESITAKYESLKNQVNPHFLFNSLNALSNLVYEDQDKAVKFIKQLSDVYRYVLETRDQEVVDLHDELKFLESYLFLQKIRFGEKLSVNIELAEVRSHVAPLALQMLIENAIKHNIVSEEDPLFIKLSSDGQYIIVENTLQKKKTLGEPSAGVGLENICKRYEMLSNDQVIIDNNGQQFIVKLPLLKNQ